jgi:hypothetical protein
MGNITHKTNTNQCNTKFGTKTKDRTVAGQQTNRRTTGTAMPHLMLRILEKQRTTTTSKNHLDANGREKRTQSTMAPPITTPSTTALTTYLASIRFKAPPNVRPATTMFSNQHVRNHAAKSRQNVRSGHQVVFFMGHVSPNGNQVENPGNIKHVFAFCRVIL